MTVRKFTNIVFATYSKAEINYSISIGLRVVLAWSKFFLLRPEL